MPLAFRSALQTGPAECAMDASAENFSKNDSDELIRLRLFSGLFNPSARGAESGAGRNPKADDPVRSADSDDATPARAT